MILLDTHALIWAMQEPQRLGARARELLLSEEWLWVSAATDLELAIKQSLGKLALAWTPGDARRTLGATFAPIDERMHRELLVLPWHHRDPFDRLLIAQARILDCPVLTRDPVFAQYPVAVIDATL